MKLNGEVQPHILLKDGELPELVITCGDPGRAKFISSFLDDSVELAFNREYRSFRGKYKGIEIGVISHGIGGAGSAICFNELAEIGVKKIIRVGTCGSLCDSLKQGDIIVCEAAVRSDGVTPKLLPIEIPAISDLDVLNSLWKYGVEYNSKDIKIIRSIVVSDSLFYPGPMDVDYSIYSKVGICGIEMEFSTLFVMGMINKIKCGGICVVDGNPQKWDEGDYGPFNRRVSDSKEIMIKIALKAVIDGNN